MNTALQNRSDKDEDTVTTILFSADGGDFEDVSSQHQYCFSSLLSMTPGDELRKRLKQQHQQISRKQIMRSSFSFSSVYLSTLK